MMQALKEAGYDGLDTGQLVDAVHASEVKVWEDQRIAKSSVASSCTHDPAFVRLQKGRFALRALRPDLEVEFLSLHTITLSPSLLANVQHKFPNNCTSNADYHAPPKGTHLALSRGALYLVLSPPCSEILLHAFLSHDISAVSLCEALTFLSGCISCEDWTTGKVTWQWQLAMQLEHVIIATLDSGCTTAI